MLNQAISRDKAPERKIIGVSLERQITIPQKYYELLGFDNEAECILQDGGLFIRPVRGIRSDFSEQILTELISQGYSGTELLQKFKEYSNAIRPAIIDIIDKADALVKSGDGRVPIDDLFGTEG